MLVTWPNSDDLSHIRFGNEYADYNIIVVKDRMKNELSGAIGFNRKTKTIENIEIFDARNRAEIQRILELCEKNQL